MPEEDTETGTEKKVSRRSILKWTGALTAAAAAGAVAGYGATELMKPPPLSFKPPLSASVQARRDAIVQDLINRHTGETITYYTPNTYRRGGCCLGVLKVHVKNGVITAIEPDDTVSPNIPREDENWNNVLEGTLQSRESGRWLAYRQMLYDPRHLIYPMKRVGARGDPNGQFVRITWTEALDILAANVKQMNEKYGPYSIFDVDSSNPVPTWAGIGISHYMTWSNPGLQFATHFALSDPSKLPSTSDLQSYGSGSQVSDMFNTKLMVFWGLTLADNGDATQLYYALLAHEKGIPIVSIGCKYNLTDEIIADQWIPIRKGTDGAMVLAVANVLIKENLYDTAFVDKFVYGFDKWKGYVMGVTDNVAKTPEWAEPITGVPAETIRAFAELYGKTKPAMLIINYGPGRGTHTEGYSWGGYILQAMMGNIGIPGGFLSADGSGRGPAAFMTYPLPNLAAQTGRKRAKTPVYSSLAPQGWFNAVRLRDQLDSGQMTKQDYHNAIGSAIDAPTPNIHMWYSTHWCLQMYENVNNIDAVIKKLDFMVSYRVAMNDSHNRVADLILPMTEEMERPSEYGSGSFTAINNGFVYCAKIVNAPGECKSQEWRDVQLAQRLGVLNDYFSKYNDYGDAKWDQMWEDMAQAAYEQWAATETIKPLDPPSWAEFRKKPVFRWKMPTTSKYGFYNEIQKGVPFPTATGKINAYSDYIAQGEAFLKTTRWGGFLDPYPAYHPEKQFGGFNDPGPNVAKYPLVVMATKSRWTTHSWMSQNPQLKGELYEHVVELSVPDAKARGIKDGDLVRVQGFTSQSNTVQLTASVTAKLTPGHVHIYVGQYWDPDPYTGIDKGGCFNVLTTDQTTPSRLRGTMSRVEVVKV